MARRSGSILGRIVAGVTLLCVAAVAFVLLGGPARMRRLWFPLRYEQLIGAEANTNDLDPYLVAALINAESGFDPAVTSKAGAVGLMQVKPSTASSVARQLGMRGKMDGAALSVPETNIRVGTRYLAYLVRRYGGDVELALAAYNAGLGNADRWAADARRTGRAFTDSIAFPETARYVENVERQRTTYRLLYPDAFGVPAR